MKTQAIYPGTFDPLTNGHLNLIERALSIFETVTVSVAVNSSKKSVFSIEERMAFIEKAFVTNDRVKVEKFEGLLVDYIAKKSNVIVMRGIRTNMDFEYELSLAQANRHLSPHFETIFMMTDPQYSWLSSSMIREIVSLGGSTNGMLPDYIEAALSARLKPRQRSSTE